MIAETAEGKKIELGSARLIQDADLVMKYDLFLVEDGQCIAALSLNDELKAGCKAAVQAIQKMGIKTILLSGDSERKCKYIADEIGISEIYFQQTPEGKLKIIERLNTEQATAMFGDGVNDAPALNMASVGISLGDASKVAWSSSQVILLQKRSLEGLPLALKLSRMTLRTIHQNLFWAFFYNVIAIPIAAAGLLQPMIAAFSMAFSDVVVIGNSIRLKYRI
jgi:Cu+-exporting ATPase